MGYSLWRMGLYYSFDIVKMVLVLWGIMGFSLKKNKIWYVTNGVLYLLFFILFSSNERLLALSENVLAFLLLINICAIIQGKLLKKLSTAILVYLCILFFDLVIVVIISLVFSKTFLEIIGDGYLYTMVNGFNIFSFSYIVWLKKKYGSIGGKNGDTKRRYILLLVGICMGILLFNCFMMLKFADDKEFIRNLLLMAIIIISLGYFVVGYLVESLKERSEADKKNSDQHLSRYIQQNDYDSKLFHTGNDTVDAILYDAQERYRKDGISIRMEGALPKEMSILTMDLCVIFSNSIKWAVESIQSLEKRMENKYYIDVKIKSVKDNIHIEIMNPIGKKDQINQEIIDTLKEDKLNHEYDFEKMNQSIIKYHGSLLFCSEINYFKIKIHMKNL